MTKTVFSVSDLCERWGLTAPTIRKLEADGVLERCLRTQGAVRYTARSVYAAEMAEFQPFSPQERRRLERELAEVRTENEKLRSILAAISVKAAEFMGGVKA